MQRFAVILTVVALGVLTVREVGAAPASQPASQPSTQPASQPASHPTSLSTSPRLDEPLPDQSSGMIVKEPGGARNLLWVPRVIFYIPKRVISLAFAPLQWLAYAWDDFQIPDRFKDVFFDDSGSFGVFPVAFMDTGIGLNAGVRLVHRNLFGEHEGLGLRASFGGRYRQFYASSLHSGRRWRHVHVELKGGYQSGEKLPFFGVGNGDEVSRDTLTQLVDPLAGDVAVKTSVRKDIAFGKLSVAAWPNSIFKAALSFEIRHQAFEEDAEERISEVFLIDRLVGVGATTFDIYPQLRLTLDTRKSVNPYMSQIMTSKGFYLNGWLGYARGFSGDPSNHLRYALDLQGYINLFAGDRVLVLRVLVDGVTAELPEIPFNDLPTLGGPDKLRGYDVGRFRDRALTLASAEYQYNLSSRATAYLFVDSGRVWRSLADFAFEDFRLGFGGGLLLHSKTSFSARIQLAGSIDGGVFVHFGLSPTYDSKKPEEGAR